MSVRRLAAEQPESFAFTPANLDWAKSQIKKYPEGKQASAVLSLLWRAQEQMGGWLPEPALTLCRRDARHGLYPRLRDRDLLHDVQSGARRPLLRAGLRHDTVLARGAEEIKSACRDLIGEPNHVTGDGHFSWTEVECLGACVNAPVAQINKYYYEDLTPESLVQLIADLKAGRDAKPGPQNGRHSSEPIGGAITLLDSEIYKNELPDDAPPNYQLQSAVELALTDSEAKRPGAAANVREAAVPKPPLAKGRKTKPAKDK